MPDNSFLNVNYCYPHGLMCDVYGVMVKAKLNRLDFGVGKDAPLSEITDEVQIEGNFEMFAQ